MEERVWWWTPGGDARRPDRRARTSRASNEACGIIAGRDGRAERFFPAQPDEPSPYCYRIDARDQIRIMNEIDDAGLDLIGIYHSHVASPAFPSGTDAEQAFWPDAVYVIVSLAGGGSS